MLPRISAFFFFLFLSSGLYSQVGQLEFTLVDSLALGTPGETIFAYGELSNNTATDVEMLLIKQVNNMPAGWSSAICTDVCAAPTVDTAFLLLRAHESQSFIMYYYTGDLPASGYTYMEFLNLDDVSNVYYQGFTGQTSEVTSTYNAENRHYLTVGPNPFTTETSFLLRSDSKGKYEKLKLEIINSFGLSIFKEEMIENEAVVFQNLSSYSGPLFYLLTGDKTILQSGKLIAK